MRGRALTPSEIARDPGPPGKDREQGKEHDMNIKPSEIAKDNTQQRPDQDHSREREQDRGR